MPSSAAAAASPHAPACLAGRLAPASCRAKALMPAPPQQPRQQRQRHRLGAQPRRLAVARGTGGSGRQPQPGPSQFLKRYGLPMLGLLAGALMIEPLLLGLVWLERTSVALVGVAGVLACLVAGVSLVWLAVPPLASIFGMKTVVTAGVAAVVLAAAAAGALKVPALLPLLLGGATLALGFQAAQVLALGGGGADARAAAAGDVKEAEGEAADGWQQEVSREAREREAELRAFDELLSSRDDGGRARGGPPLR